MKIDNTVAAVVTGGASGLGEATARALAAKGAKVAIFDLQREKGEAVAADIGGIFCEVNVTSDESVDAGFARAREARDADSRTTPGLLSRRYRRVLSRWWRTRPVEWWRRKSWPGLRNGWPRFSASPRSFPEEAGRSRRPCRCPAVPCCP